MFSLIFVNIPGMGADKTNGTVPQIWNEINEHLSNPTFAFCHRTHFQIVVSFYLHTWLLLLHAKRSVRHPYMHRKYLVHFVSSRNSFQWCLLLTAGGCNCSCSCLNRPLGQQFANMIGRITLSLWLQARFNPTYKTTSFWMWFVHAEHDTNHDQCSLLSSRLLIIDEYCVL